MNGPVPIVPGRLMPYDFTVTVMFARHVEMPRPTGHTAPARSESTYSAPAVTCNVALSRHPSLDTLPSEKTSRPDITDRNDNHIRNNCNSCTEA